ncbi:hypothetical protein PP707_02200 [Acetobacter pasteurianus]|nr:hypothetical protein [Acetobacter pasteurianus]
MFLVSVLFYFPNFCPLLPPLFTTSNHYSLPLLQQFNHPQLNSTGCTAYTKRNKNSFNNNNN